MRRAWRWLLFVNHFARVGRRKTWHSLSCFAIKSSPARADARVFRTCASPHAASASHQRAREHRNGCGFEKHLALNTIDPRSTTTRTSTLYNSTLLFRGSASLFHFYIPPPAYSSDLDPVKTNNVLYTYLSSLANTSFIRVWAMRWLFIHICGLIQGVERNRSTTIYGTIIQNDRDHNSV